jgi:hypothetical protein
MTTFTIAAATLIILATAGAFVGVLLTSKPPTSRVGACPTTAWTKSAPYLHGGAKFRGAETVGHTLRTPCEVARVLCLSRRRNTC